MSTSWEIVLARSQNRSRDSFVPGAAASRLNSIKTPKKSTIQTLGFHYYSYDGTCHASCISNRKREAKESKVMGDYPFGGDSGK
jgi:hypothetical protein